MASRRRPSDNHHIGKVSQRLKVVKHVFRSRQLCSGNAAYERAMAEARIEFEQSEQRRKTRPKQIRIF